jgi:hypothetical protein
LSATSPSSPRATPLPQLFSFWFTVETTQERFRSSVRPSSSPKPKNTVVDPFTFQTLAKCSPRNSFVLKMIHFNGGGVPPLPPAFDVPSFRRSDESRSIPSLFIILQTHLHNGRCSTLLESIHCAHFSSRRGVPPPGTLLCAPLRTLRLCVIVFPSSAILSRVGIRQSQIHSHPRSRGASCSRFG